MTETDSAISGGSVRDVLADTNNLSERWKTASGPVHCGPGPTTDDWGWVDGAGGPGSYTASRTTSVFPPRLSPLRSSRCPEERYAQSTWPESHPVSTQKRPGTAKTDQNPFPDLLHEGIGRLHEDNNTVAGPHRIPRGTRRGPATVSRQRSDEVRPRGACSRPYCRRPGQSVLAGAGTTRSTSGWTVSSCRMAASAPGPSPAARASTMREW